MAFGVRVTSHGPLFNGQAARAVRDFSEDLEEEGAEWALGHMRRTFSTSFKEPTGYYESHVRVSNTVSGHQVWDGGQIAYGPWLEGVGSRNNASRFKGYWAFRKAASALDARIESMGNRILRARYMRRIG